MTPDSSTKVDLVLQYALLVAGGNDERFDRQLGPIHLLKYVYLADLFHAEKNEGATYTGIRWQFYKFGPWSQSVYGRIEPALNLIGADKKSFPSDYEDKEEWFRWSMSDEELLQEKESLLPPAIKLHLRRDILKFGKDTQSLLHYVYSTKPMLSAAPNELLDFSVAHSPSVKEPSPQPLRADNLSSRKKKEFGKRMCELRASHKNRQRKDLKLINPVKNPRYDDVYFKGLAWLDSLAGEPFSEGEYIAEFSEEVWKSSARKGQDVS